MLDDLYSSFSKFDTTLEKQVKSYSGLLGLTSDKNSAVEVPDRNGYVYVRFRDNQSEVVSAYNEKVSPVNDLPVVVARQESRWVILGRDIDRYENWGGYSAFLPEHGFQHEFPRDNPGGDIVYTYANQFMPLNVYPSGTPGSPNVLIGPYSFKKSDDSWVYVNTGTPSLLTYLPDDNQARVVLVYLDRDTGNPGLLVNSGTSFAVNLTGTGDVLPYIPPHTALQEPVKAVRLVSGTTYVGWENLYDVRQFYSRDITGSGGGLPTLDANRVVITDDTGTITDDEHFYYDYETNTLMVGANSLPLTPSQAINIVGSGSSPSWNLWAFGTGTRGLAAFEMAAGSKDAPTAVQDGMPLGRISWRGYDGANLATFGTTRAQIEARAVGDFVSGTNAGTEIITSITPSGTTSIVDMLTVDQDGANLAYGTYNISGSAHQHNYLNLSNRPAAETSAFEVFRVSSPGGVSAFAATIATLPGGAVLTYSLTSGNKDAIIPYATSNLAKITLHNTTRGNSALILNSVGGATNNITLTDTVPGDWQVGDVITITSQTVSGGGLSWFDLQIVTDLTGKTDLFLIMVVVSATAGDRLSLHPFESYAASKLKNAQAQTSAASMEVVRLLKITSDVFSAAWTGTPSALAIREEGYLQ